MLLEKTSYYLYIPCKGGRVKLRVILPNPLFHDGSRKQQLHDILMAIQACPLQSSSLNNKQKLWVNYLEKQILHHLWINFPIKVQKEKKVQEVKLRILIVNVFPMMKHLEWVKRQIVIITQTIQILLKATNPSKAKNFPEQWWNYFKTLCAQQ